MLYHAIEKYGSRWAIISVEVFNSTRPENQVKNRRNSAAFKKFIIKTFGQEAFDAIDPKRAESKRKGSDKESTSKRAKKV